MNMRTLSEIACSSGLPRYLKLGNIFLFLDKIGYRIIIVKTGLNLI